MMDVASGASYHSMSHQTVVRPGRRLADCQEKASSLESLCSGDQLAASCTPGVNKYKGTVSKRYSPAAATYTEEPIPPAQATNIGISAPAWSAPSHDNQNWGEQVSPSISARSVSTESAEDREIFPLLPKFKGNSDPEAAITHLLSFDKFISNNKISNEDLILRLFENSLTSEAKVWFQNILPCDSLQDTKRLFMDQYYLVTDKQFFSFDNFSKEPYESSSAVEAYELISEIRQNIFRELFLQEPIKTTASVACGSVDLQNDTDHSPFHNTAKTKTTLKINVKPQKSCDSKSNHIICWDCGGRNHKRRDCRFRGRSYRGTGIKQNHNNQGGYQGHGRARRPTNLRNSSHKSPVKQALPND